MSFQHAPPGRVFLVLQRRIQVYIKKGKQNSMANRIFTSESVTEGHPDKICDQISDAVLDAILDKDPMARVACETCTTTGMVMIMGEITTSAQIDIPAITRNVIVDIGYDRAKYGFDGHLNRLYHQDFGLNCNSYFQHLNIGKKKLLKH
mgnify:CR=1 FL=1